MTDERPPDWLRITLGKESGPEPPDIRSDRVKDLLRQAMLQPGQMRPSEVQELAAAVVSHLIRCKD